MCKLNQNKLPVDVRILSRVDLVFVSRRRLHFDGGGMLGPACRAVSVHIQRELRRFLLTRKCFMPGFTATSLHHFRNGSDAVKDTCKNNKETHAEKLLMLRWESNSQRPAPRREGADALLLRHRRTFPRLILTRLAFFCTSLLSALLDTFVLFFARAPRCTLPRTLSPSRRAEVKRRPD